MANEQLSDLFSLRGQAAIVTGGTGVLGGAMARGLAAAGACVGIVGRRAARAEAVAAEIRSAGGEALALPADVLEQDQLEAAREKALEAWGRLDILVNAAGGNVPEATLRDDQLIVDMPFEAFERVVALNLHGTLLPIQVFGRALARDGGQGCIVNISSMAAQRAITRVAGYAAAKAAVENLTRWLAVDLARKCGAGLRVNAIAPGFFIGEQNRALLLNDDGSLTPRGQQIVDHTPSGRFGEPRELIGTLIWLCSPAASFVNGAVIPVDGGFSAFSGV